MSRLDQIRETLDAPDMWPGIRVGVENRDIRALLDVAEAARHVYVAPGPYEVSGLEELRAALAKLEAEA